MRRIQFIELHEQAWFPSSIRDEVTDVLQFGLNLLNAYGPIVPVLRSALERSGSGSDVVGSDECRSNVRRSAVDLCSGGGGPWLALSRQFEGTTALHIWLTDKYPNLTSVKTVGTASETDHITYYQSSVDAMKVPVELKGFRTMFTSFHHFSPEEARAVLQNAVDAGEGIGIFEITRRAPSMIGLMFGWALLLFVSTPWIRPFRWSRLLWTYLVPIIPIVLVFDGIVSCLRTYRPQELREIVANLGASEYEWEIGEHSGAVPITYLVGCPRR
jgi:hypothetical protein